MLPAHARWTRPTAAASPSVKSRHVTSSSSVTLNVSPGAAADRNASSAASIRFSTYTSPATARPAVDEHHIAGADRARDLADDIFGARAVDRGRPEDQWFPEPVDRPRRARTSVSVFELGLRVPVREAVARRASRSHAGPARVAVHVGRSRSARDWLTEEASDASSRSRVPPTFVSALISSTVAQSETSAPQCRTYRQPSAARRKEDADVRSPTASSTPSDFRAVPPRLRDRSKTADLVALAVTNRSARCPPTNPLAPVTRQTSPSAGSTGVPRNAAGAPEPAPPSRATRRRSVVVAIFRTSP